MRVLLIKSCFFVRQPPPILFATIFLPPAFLESVSRRAFRKRGGLFQWTAPPTSDSLYCGAN